MPPHAFSGDAAASWVKKAGPQMGRLSENQVG
jgi:hypothetical protein